MRYIHRLGQETSVESASTSFHLSHPAGGYLSLGQPNVTRYQGLTRILPFGETWDLFKTIESIRIDSQADTLILTPDGAERVSPQGIERFSVTTGATTYDVRMPRGKVHITLDMRAIHDFATEGRRYEILDIPGGHVITYHCPRYSFSLAIIGGRAQCAQNWQQAHYPYDARRGSLADLWVNDCLTYDVEHSLSLRFGVGWTPADAIKDAGQTAPAPQTLLPQTTKRDAALAAASLDLERSILTLPHLGTGIIAGYPWFFQVYTRDEAISAGALIMLGAHEQAKTVLLRAVAFLHVDGRISNRTPDSELASADGVGWAFLRLRQLFTTGALTANEQETIHALLRRSIEGLEKQWLSQRLIHNGWKETWMDTTGTSSDGRPGARIEIQALTYSMYVFAAALCKERGGADAEYYLSRAQQLRDAVRELFYDERTGSLADGVDDHVDRTARPNLFIAAYAAPELFSKEEWRRILRNALDRLWLPWGGLATIDHEHLLFTPRHTGEDDRSYHRGDSWYFLNNIAGIVLHETGFEGEANALLASARKQLLQLGIPGHAAETSGATEQEAVGCYVQTWSAAMFIELHLCLQGVAVRPGLSRFDPSSSSATQ